MTPGQAQWIMWLFGAVFGWLVASMLHRNERLRLRVALGDLVDALLSRPRPTGEHGRWLDLAIDRALKVLDGQP